MFLGMTSLAPRCRMWQDWSRAHPKSSSTLLAGTAAPGGCRGGPGVLQGRGELGRAGSFSQRSQRKPGFPSGLVLSKLVSQILLSLAEACPLLHLLWAAETVRFCFSFFFFFKVLKSRSLCVNPVLRCPQTSGCAWSPPLGPSRPWGACGGHSWQRATYHSGPRAISLLPSAALFLPAAGASSVRSSPQPSKRVPMPRGRLAGPAGKEREEALPQGVRKEGAAALGSRCSKSSVLPCRSVR